MAARNTNPNRIERTKGGSRVVYRTVISRGVDTDGIPFEIEEEVPYAKVKVKGEKTYEVPFDPKTGRVTNAQLYQRYLDTTEGVSSGCKRRSVSLDSRTDSSIIHNIPDGGFTPEGIVKSKWWQHPGQSDIRGIDTVKGKNTDLWEDVAKSAAPATKKIALLVPVKDREKIEHVLSTNFTAEELNKAVAEKGMVVMTGDPGKRYSGRYCYSQGPDGTPMIVLKKGASEDTITHEMVHHLRCVDPDRQGIARTPYPIRKNGSLDLNAYKQLSAQDRNSRHNLEEASTVFETDARTSKPTGVPSGYYHHTSGPGTPAEKYMRDRKLIAPNGQIIGRNAINGVSEHFTESEISTLRDGGRGRTAANAYRESINLGLIKTQRKPSTVGKKAAPVKAPKKKAEPKGYFALYGKMKGNKNFRLVGMGELVDRLDDAVLIEDEEQAKSFYDQMSASNPHMDFELRKTNYVVSANRRRM